MPATEFHHDSHGVLVLWGHSCGHFSNSIRYDSAKDAEAVRAAQEARPCFECRRAQATLLSAEEFDAVQQAFAKHQEATPALRALLTSRPDEGTP